MKKLILISMIIASIVLSACGAKNQTAANTNGTTAASANNNSAISTDKDAANATLKNSTPVNVAPETIKKNVEIGAKVTAKMASVDNTLNSIGDFNVTDNSGLK